MRTNEDYEDSRTAYFIEINSKKIFFMMAPELFFVYYSFKTHSSWQIRFLENEELHLHNFDNNEVMKTNVPALKKAIEDKRLKEHTKQNEMIKYYNSIKK